MVCRDPWIDGNCLNILYSAKGEECIPQTWDMFHEKWGFMIIFWNFAGVPFVCITRVFLLRICSQLPRRTATLLCTWHLTILPSIILVPRHTSLSTFFSSLHTTCKSCPLLNRVPLIYALSASTRPCPKRVDSGCKCKASRLSAMLSLSSRGASSKTRPSSRRSTETAC